MSRTPVSLTRLTDYDDARVAAALSRHIELLGGLDRFVKPGDSVLLKPNFIAPRSRRHAAQTHPAVLLALASLLKDYGARPFVADSPAWSNVRTCVKALRLDEPLDRLGVPVFQLDNPRWLRLEKLDVKVGLSARALDVDVIINLPKFKSHQQLVATFAVKNMFGCVSGKHKALWHFRKGRDPLDFCTLLIEIYKTLAPALTIIDGVLAMDGQGPIHGRTRPLGWLIGGTDPIACERICCKLIGFEPDDLPMLRAAKAVGYGCPDLESLDLLGDPPPEAPCRDFQPARLTPLRFSLPHVCRSVARQAVLLLKPDRTQRPPSK